MRITVEFTEEWSERLLRLAKDLGDVDCSEAACMAIALALRILERSDLGTDLKNVADELLSKRG